MCVWYVNVCYVCAVVHTPSLTDSDCVDRVSVTIIVTVVIH